MLLFFWRCSKSNFDTSPWYVLILPDILPNVTFAGLKHNHLGTPDTCSNIVDTINVVAIILDYGASIKFIQ